MHRSRVEALILAGALTATKSGSQWVLGRGELDRYDNVRPRRRGRPLGASMAWARIGRPDVLMRRRDPGSLDADRRDLRARAVHEALSVHPGVLGEGLDDPEVRLGGRDAAIDAGAPLDPDGVHDVYLPARLAQRWRTLLRARLERDQPNVWLHVVPDDAWVEVPPHRHLWLVVAWLDLADRLDRGADVVLDRLGGGRARA